MARFGAHFLERGGIWLAGQGLLFLGVACLGWIGRDTFVCPHARLVSALIFLLGGVVGSGGLLALGRNLTPYPVPGEGQRLVTTGIYRFMRHPLYVSVWLVALAWSLRCGSWPALGCTVALGLFFDAKARREEFYLNQRFPDYPAYARRVCRFIPGLW